ncbi:MAG: twin-arginine translocation signal domain-containing protein [Cyanobacteria bacterium]|nr:twin-arginine translocation signal domain-containing protein [Cyanobacteriota bacterium]
MPNHEKPSQENTSVINVSRRDFLKQAALLGGSALTLGTLTANPLLAAEKSSNPTAVIPPSAPAGPRYTAKNFNHLTTGLPGMSATSIQNHLKLYEGYVKKINEIQDQIAGFNGDLGTVNGTYHPFRELHVEQSFALNATVLHELYFENLGSGTEPSSDVQAHFTECFGDWKTYTTQLNALGKSMRGWVMTAYNLRDGRIHNYGLDMHNTQVPLNVCPLLVLDVYEHAYFGDYGTNRAGYLDAFFKNIDWTKVDARLKASLHHPVG